MMPKILRQVLSLFLLIVFLSSIVMTLARLQDPLPPWIVFISTREGDFEIYTMRSDGSEQEKLIHGTGYYDMPTWSSDGQWILFRGNPILYSEDWGIYRIRPSRRNIEILPQYNKFNDGNTFSLSTLTWSPDGQWGLFLDTSFTPALLYRMRADRSNIQLLAQLNQPSVPVWSPDSQQFFLSVSASIRAHSEQGHFPEDFNILRMNADGSDPQQLTHDVGFSPTWSPDGEWIVFISNRDGEYRLYRMRPDGSEQAIYGDVGAQIYKSSPDEPIQERYGDFGTFLGPGITQVRWMDHQHLLLEVRDGLSDIYLYNVNTETVTRLTRSAGDMGSNMSPIPSPIIDLPWRGLVMMLFSFLLLGFTFPTRKFILSNIRLLANRS